jgi:hypothetical protein
LIATGSPLRWVNTTKIAINKAMSLRILFAFKLEWLLKRSDLETARFIPTLQENFF